MKSKYVVKSQISKAFCSADALYALKNTLTKRWNSYFWYVFQKSNCWSFLENLENEYHNMKKKINQVTSYENIKKLPGTPIIEPKLRYEFKKFCQKIPSSSEEKLQTIIYKVNQCYH